MGEAGAEGLVEELRALASRAHVEVAAALYRKADELAERLSGLDRLEDERSKLLAINLENIDKAVAAEKRADASDRALAEARAEREELRGAIFGSDFFDPKLPNASFVEMARTTEAARQGAVHRAHSAERERDEALEALRCAGQQCATAVYNIAQREHDEAVVRSFQSIADFCARSVLENSKSALADANSKESLSKDQEIAGLREEVEAEQRRFDYVRVQRDGLAAELANRVSRRHEELMAEALAEIKASVDGDSSQPIRDIVYGLLAEIEALPTRSALSQNIGKNEGEA